jgi:hypothetical protein
LSDPCRRVNIPATCGEHVVAAACLSAEGLGPMRFLSNAGWIAAGLVVGATGCVGYASVVAETDDAMTTDAKSSGDGAPSADATSTDGKADGNAADGMIDATFDGRTGAGQGDGGESEAGLPDVGPNSLTDVEAGPASTYPDGALQDVTTTACSAGALRCNGLQAQTCDPSGTWQDTGATCPYVCSAGACTGTCVPSSTQCSGLQPQTCDGAGAWQNQGEACEFSCGGGACSGSCTPGASQCNGPQPQACADGGVWQATGDKCNFVCDGGV